MRALADRYRAQARAVIAAVDRVRTGAATACSQNLRQDSLIEMPLTDRVVGFVRVRP